MIRRHHIFVFAIAILCFVQANGQQTILKGRVLSAVDSIALPGASVMIKGSKVGGITDFDGNFRFAVNTNVKGKKLVVSYLGFKNKEVRIDGRDAYTVYLQPGQDELDEVVITSSYGTSKLKEEVVGSISTINERDINSNQSYETLDKMIQGLAPGVQIESNTQLGTATRINIRGQGTFTPTTGNLLNASAQPLIIVDGVILSEENGFDDQIFDGGSRFGEQFLNPLSKIPPEDVKSISILKDAAAVSVYGANGSNGVILITTKSGGKSGFELSVSQQNGISHPIDQIDFMSGPQYHSILVDYYQNAGETLASAQQLAGNADVDTDWFQLMNETGFFNRSQVNFSDNIGDLNYRANASFLHNDEVQRGNTYSTFRGSLSMNYNLDKWDFDLRLTPSFVDKQNPNTLFSFPLKPNVSPFNEDGSFNTIGEGAIGNPLAVLEQNRSRAKTYGLIANLTTNFQWNDHWSWKNIIGFDYTDKQQDRYFSGDNASGQLSGSFEQNGEIFPNWGRKVLFNRDVEKYTFNSVINYENEFGEHHHIDGILGAEIMEESLTNERFFGSGYVEQSPNNTLADANEVDFASFTSENARTSFFTQLNYDFKKKYFVTASFRQDKSSAFGGDIDAAYNGALGASWVLSKEDLIDTAKAIDFLRIRASLGSSGNSRIGSFRARGLYNLNLTDTGGYNFGDSAFPTTAPNPNLGWERNFKLNAGLDINFLKKFQWTINVYRDKITDIISSTNTVPESGFTTVQANIGSMENKGVEISLSYEAIKTEDVQWDINANLSHNQNEVLSVENLSSPFSASRRASALRVGASTSAIWGAQWVGVDPATGRNLYRVDDEIVDGATYTEEFDNSDWEIIGDRLPDFNGGLQTSLQLFDRLNVSMRFTYSFGADQLIRAEREFTNQLLTTQNMMVEVLDYWQQPGDIARNSRPAPGQPIVRNSTKYVYDTSHIKFQNLSINYRLKSKWLDNIGLSKTSVFLNADNLGYWYPNAGSSTNTIAELRFAYPEMRTISLGLNASI